MPFKPIPISRARGGPGARTRESENVIDRHDDAYIASDKGASSHRIRRYNEDGEEDGYVDGDEDGVGGLDPVARDGYGGSVPSSSVGRDVQMQDLLSNAKHMVKPASLGVARDYEVIPSPSSRVLVMPNPADQSDGPNPRPGFGRHKTEDDWDIVGKDGEDEGGVGAPGTSQKKGYAEALKGLSGNVESQNNP